jgi:hypothetical protein
LLESIFSAVLNYSFHKKMVGVSGIEPPAGRNFLQQEAEFDDFTEIFNDQRPHEALDMKCPAEV